MTPQIRKERTYKVIMTNEARVLKKLRVDAGLSVREAAKLFGKSHGMIVQIESGRQNVPRGERLMQLLRVYGIEEYTIFYDRVRKFEQRLTPREEVLELVAMINDERIGLLLKVAKRIAEGKALIML